MCNCDRINALPTYRLLLGVLFAVLALVLSGKSNAESRNEAFYNQLLKLPASNGYHPTRSFTIITDAEHGNRLVAEDDENLRFNLLWMEHFRPGYRTTRGGAALGEIVRTYLKSIYKSYRERNSDSAMLAALPDENGELGSSYLDGGEMDYGLKVTEKELRLSLQYRY